MNNNPDVKFEILRMPPENTNSVLVSSGTDAVIFDPWGHVTDWENVLAARGLTLRAIYATHGHSDHIAAAPDLAVKYNAPWYLNQADHDLILWGNPILDMFELPRIPDDFARPNQLVAGLSEILSRVKMQAIPTPGHSAGGMMFWFPEYDILISGDTLFHDGVGRTDLPGGNTDALRKSIRNIQDMHLSPETYVVHGHGTDSTMDWLEHNHPYFLIRHCHCGDGGCCGGHHHCGCGHCNCDKESQE